MNEELRSLLDGKTILLVDDDVDFVKENQAQLEAVGAHVLTAESAKAAEEVLKANSVDLAVIGLMLEHMDSGLVLSYHIKKASPTTPVILISGAAGDTGIGIDAATEEERSWVKADVMLEKPVRFEQLAWEMERLLEEWTHY